METLKYLKRDTEIENSIKNFFRGRFTTEDELTHFILTHNFNCSFGDITYFTIEDNIVFEQKGYGLTLNLINKKE